jgi:flagellar biosynthesis/type III secretory pathway M-ring protein FliF/YscJ
MITDINQIKKVNSKLITPLIVLGGTAIVAVFTYFKHYPVSDWLIIVFVSVIIFLVIALIIEKMLNRFLEINFEKAEAERLEAERLEEEARAAMEAEGGEDKENLETQDISSQF